MPGDYSDRFEFEVSGDEIVMLATDLPVSDVPRERHRITTATDLEIISVSAESTVLAQSFGSIELNSERESEKPTVRYSSANFHSTEKRELRSPNRQQLDNFWIQWPVSDWWKEPEVAQRPLHNEDIAVMTAVGVGATAAVGGTSPSKACNLRQCRRRKRRAL